MAGEVIDDTVTAEIVPTDLHSLIYPVKIRHLIRHFAEHGRLFVSPDYGQDFETKMSALAAGKPQQRLQSDRTAREVVRAILTSKRPYGPVFEGTYICGIGTPPPMTVLNVHYGRTLDRLEALMGEGLLASPFGDRPWEGWCFESELIYNKVVGPGGSPCTCAAYEPNQALRNAIIAMLKPFEAEKPRYVHPEGR